MYDFENDPRNKERTNRRDGSLSANVREIKYKTVRAMDVDMLIYDKSNLRHECFIEACSWFEFTAKHKASMAIHSADLLDCYAMLIVHEDWEDQKPWELHEDDEITVWVWDGKNPVEGLQEEKMTWREKNELIRDMHDEIVRYDKVKKRQLKDKK